jgi:segregation and condensation protein A
MPEWLVNKLGQPWKESTTEEEQSIHDLEERLRSYQRIKDLSLHIKERFGEQISFPKNQSRTITPVFSPDDSMTVPALFQSIKSVLEHMPKKEALPKAVVKKVISLEDMITSLTHRIKSNLKMSFREFAKVGKEEKVHVIVSFLAMLELVKQGMIMVSQETGHGDINIETQELGVPHYS